MGSMRRRLRALATVSALALVALAAPVAGAPADTARAQVAPDSDAIVRLGPAGRGVNLGVALTADQARWRRDHAVIVVGLVPDQRVPFDLLGFDRDYEGISADYLDIVGRTLAIELRYRSFATRADALMALERGDVDIVPTVSRLDAGAAQALALTEPYFSTRLVEVIATNRPINSQGPHRVASASEPLSLPAVREAHPEAVLVDYPGVLEGLRAVASHEVDALMCNSASANFLIDQYRLSTLRAYGVADSAVMAQHFAVRRSDSVLVELVDQVLDAVPARTAAAIATHWSAAAQPRLVSERINLSPAERQWIADHPVVRFATRDDAAPFMFRDASGRLAGVTIEMLRRIGMETGLRFEPGERFDGSLGASDLAPLLVRVRGGDAGLAPSAPYHRAFRVFVGRADQPALAGPDAHLDGAEALASLDGQRLAFVASDHALVQRVQARVPGLALVPVTSVTAAYDAVRSGRADLTLASVKSAGETIARRHAGVLKIAGPLGAAPIALKIGVRPDAPALLSIIDKALQVLPPDSDAETRAMAAYLAGGPVIDWRRHVGWLYGGAALLLIGVVLMALWMRSLQKSVRRREQAEAGLRAQLTFQRAMLEGIPHAICIRDDQARLLDCNSAYERLFLQSRATLLGTTLAQVSPAGAETEALAVHAKYLRLLGDGGSLGADADVTIHGQAKRIWHWAATIAGHEGGPAQAIVAGALDVTERHQLLQLIEAARVKAEAANRAKSNFLATISHEIRTPMNAVLGMLELVMREGRLGGDDRESVELARTSAKQLLGLIDDILDISKIDAGGLEVTPYPAQLRPIVREVAQVFSGMARRRGLTIAIEIDPRVAKWHEVDPTRFRQIVNNLVSNAIKYTDAGGVTIRLRRETLQGGDETVNLEVTDTGIGIADEEVGHLFQPFFQAESAGPRTAGGTGLGLPIVQRLCHSMGSDISVQSEPGRGTVVSIDFTLPVAQAPSASRAPDTGSVAPFKLARGRYNVLVVDDHPANRMLLRRQLAHLGLRSTAAENGQLALELWCNGRFDIVITDLSMPVMDGYEFTAAMRAHERTMGWRRCPVLGCTAHVQEHDRRRALATGMDECLMKPIDVDTLTASLQRHLANHVTTPGETPAQDGGQGDDHGGEQSGEQSGEQGGGQGDAPQAEHAARAPAHPFDLATLHNFSGGDAKVEASFLEALLRTNLDDLEELQNQARGNDAPAVAASAHKIKGAARIVRAERVVHDCESLEHAAQGGVGAEIDAALARLTHSLDEFNDAMRSRLRVYDRASASS